MSPLPTQECKYIPNKVLDKNAEIGILWKLTLEGILCTALAWSSLPWSALVWLGLAWLEWIASGFLVSPQLDKSLR